NRRQARWRQARWRRSRGTVDTAHDFRLTVPGSRCIRAVSKTRSPEDDADGDTPRFGEYGERVARPPGWRRCCMEHPPRRYSRRPGGRWDRGALGQVGASPHRPRPVLRGTEAATPPIERRTSPLGGWLVRVTARRV